MKMTEPNNWPEHWCVKGDGDYVALPRAEAQEFLRLLEQDKSRTRYRSESDNVRVMELEIECSKLWEKLEVAKEALEIIKDISNDLGVIQQAQAALEKINE